MMLAWMGRGALKLRTSPAFALLLVACSGVLGIEERRQDSASNYPASGYEGCRPEGTCSGCLDVHQLECELRSNCLAAAVREDCAGCVCQNCGDAVVACQLDTGCAAIWDCLKQSRCDLSAGVGGGCLEACAAVIEAEGGPSGAAFRAAAEVRTCAVTASCSSCLAAEPTPAASCSRDNACQGCPDCFRECLCSGERFGACKTYCGEAALPATCTPENSCVGCSSCFELCACDGGNFEECNSACQTPLPPPATDTCQAATGCNDCSDCLATCACEGGEQSACASACAPPAVNDVCVDAVQSGGEDTCGGCGGCIAQCSCEGAPLEECMVSCGSCSKVSGGDDMTECACATDDGADACAERYFSCDDASACGACSCDLCPGQYALCQETQGCPAVFSCLVATNCQGSACQERCGGVASGGGSGSEAFDVAEALWACHQANSCQCEAGPAPVTVCPGPDGDVECANYEGTDGASVAACCPTSVGTGNGEGSACGLDLQRYFQNARSCEPRDQGKRPRLLEGCSDRTIFEPPYNGVKLSGCCHQADNTCGVYDDIMGLGCLSSSVFGIQPAGCGLL
ncbi:MAG: hypothetical protein RL033_5534 [Pseudomonadota bacterium]|jgi:hypothetical protein